MSRWIAMHCGEEIDELQARHPSAFLLLCQIARRAKWKDCPIANMKAGEAFIGDWKKAGLRSPKAYQNAKDFLTKVGLVAFKGGNKGTRATLIDSRIFSTTGEERGKPEGKPGGSKGETRGKPGGTNHTDTQNTPTTKSTFSLARNGQEFDSSPNPLGNSPITPADIYEAYPRHVAWPRAMKAIAKARKKNAAEFLLDRAKAYAEAVKGTDPKFIPHPATWFNDERFNESPEEWNPQTVPPARRNSTDQFSI